MKNKYLFLVFKITISLIILVCLFRITDLSQFKDRITGLPPIFIIFGWIYYSICQWLSAYRWQLFLTAKDIHVPIQKLFSFYMVGMFMNNFLPGAVAGDVVKTYDLYQYTKQGNYAVVSVFLERFTGLIGLVVIAIIVALANIDLIRSSLILGTLIFTLLLLLGIIFLIWFEPAVNFNHKLMNKLLPAIISERLQYLYQALHSYKGHPYLLCKAIAISIIIQFLFAFYYALAALVLDIQINFLYFILFLPTITIISMLPISFGGLGIREGTMVLLFAEVGVSSADVLSISLTVYIINTLLSLWGGIILFLRRTDTK